MTEPTHEWALLRVVRGQYGSWAVELFTRDRMHVNSLGSLVPDDWPGHYSSHHTPAAAMRAFAESLDALGDADAQARMMDIYTGHNGRCPGEGYCHAPATWCEECGDVGTVCHRDECPIHSGRRKP